MFNKQNISADIKFKNAVKLSDPEGIYLKAFDAGANIFAGYELPVRIFFQLNTQPGVLKINPKIEGETGDKTSITNTGFGLSAGYRF